MNSFPGAILRKVTFNLNAVRLGAPLYFFTPKKLINCYTTTSISASIPKKSFANKLAEKFSFFSISKTRLKANSYLLFESVADQLNYADIFKRLNLPDTFYSWFVVTELYIWMLMVRYMAEGEDGKVVRNYVLQALWADVHERSKKLTPTGLVGIKSQIVDLSGQLNAALIGYDEGLNSSDVVLAGALWRRLYQQKSVDPEHLDMLVKYIRRQIKIMDCWTHKELFHKVSVRWEPIK
ncbi:hypothetical protein RN001_006824 [Aquatica leii]|uniref:Ubiquinol-cytochrome c chaperone domain-containing protein n=1 Tax=Aquatica leii TaxID=1421715 RepID=A0AAN7Q948_9COLE|nr:hypothetical protein RN001_006824 [Aquatica leii]